MPSSAVLHKFKHGALHSGGPKGPVVTSRAQAVAIMLSERRAEKANGGHYPEKGKHMTQTPPSRDAGGKVMPELSKRSVDTPPSGPRHKKKPKHAHVLDEGTDGDYASFMRGAVRGAFHASHTRY